MGSTTAHSQQVFLIEQEQLQKNLPSEMEPIPRNECLINLESLINSLQEDGDSIVFAVDANETKDECSTHDGSTKSNNIEALLKCTGL